jgi:hypothetical protein
MGAMKDLWMTEVIKGREQGLCTCEYFPSVYDESCTHCKNAVDKAVEPLELRIEALSTSIEGSGEALTLLWELTQLIREMREQKEKWDYEYQKEKWDYEYKVINTPIKAKIGDPEKL